MRPHLRLLFALFTVSGFTGLIYESIWSHYLKLFLGSAAFAQSFVLSAFMGGMAIGAWWASRWSARLADPLAAYGWVEALIGVAALVFHECFVALTGVSRDYVFAALGSPALVELFTYSLCALLIVPQTVLLGMTFPLLSGAVIRRAPAHSGQHLALLYFTNSIGAALGALAAAFWLLGWLAMPGTLRLAGVLNLGVAACVLLLAARNAPPAPPPASRSGATGDASLAGSAGAPVRLLIVAAFVTGAASFVYEIVWVRMLALVLGSSYQAFELMLSAFIAGLALGGLWIRKRIDRLANPMRFAGLVQIAMGLAAVATVFVYHATFDWMAWVLSILARKDQAYPVFLLFSHGIAFAVMLPATFLAGMTLPLFTYMLLRSGRGERALGEIYAANTLGAIAGVLLTAHLLLPDFGLKLALLLGAAADMLLGAWLLRRSGAARQRFEAFAGLIVGMLAAVTTARVAALEPDRLSSGVYRYGKASLADARVVFYRDGKTASVAVRAARDGSLSIATNGKPDAAMQLDLDRPPTTDEYTMALAGALPLLARPDAKTIANIGFGAGLTTEVLLSHSGPRAVDTIEIEPAMVWGARAFTPRVLRPYRDPRSTIHYEDAKSFFARQGRRYDIIVSEPSNPWVNGVAGLFTTEFYRDVKRYLAPRGILAQWLHLYEMDDRLLASIFAALDENFGDYRVYQGNADDLIVLASAERDAPAPGALPEAEPNFLAELRRIGITRRAHIEMRLVATRSQLAPLNVRFDAPVNSDFRPFVQLEAARARFTTQRATAILDLANAPLPINEMLAGLSLGYPDFAIPAGASTWMSAARDAQLIKSVLLDQRIVPNATARNGVAQVLLALRERRSLCGERPDPFALANLHAVAAYTLVHLAAADRQALWLDPSWIGCSRARVAEPLQRRLALYRAVALRDAPEMHRLAERQLRETPQTHSDWSEYLLLSALLGAQAAGRSDEARRLWIAHGPAIYGDDARVPPYVGYVADWHRR